MLVSVRTPVNTAALASGVRVRVRVCVGRGYNSQARYTRQAHSSHRSRCQARPHPTHRHTLRRYCGGMSESKFRPCPIFLGAHLTSMVKW